MWSEVSEEELCWAYFIITTGFSFWGGNGGLIYSVNLPSENSNFR